MCAQTNWFDWRHPQSTASFLFISLAERPRKERERPERNNNNNNRQLNKRESDIVVGLIAFFVLSILFFVIGKLAYLINPWLLSVPLGVYAILLYYIIDEYDWSFYSLSSYFSYMFVYFLLAGMNKLLGQKRLSRISFSGIHFRNPLYVSSLVFPVIQFLHPTVGNLHW